MKNKLIDLNNHLFAQLERLSDESLKGEDLEEEIIRSRAITDVGKTITANATLALSAEKLKKEYGLEGAGHLPAMIEGKDNVK